AETPPLASDGVGIERLVPVVKRRRHLLQQVRSREVDAIERHAPLEHLFAVAHIGGALDPDRTGEGGGLEPLATLDLHRCKGAADRLRRKRAGVADMRAYHL